MQVVLLGLLATPAPLLACALPMVLGLGGNEAPAENSTAEIVSAEMNCQSGAPGARRHTLGRGDHARLYTPLPRADIRGRGLLPLPADDAVPHYLNETAPRPLRC